MASCFLTANELTMNDDGLSRLK